MNDRLTTLERAFQLARTGEYAKVSDIRTKLLQEGYGDAGTQLYGPSLRRQLSALCVTARETK